QADKIRDQAMSRFARLAPSMVLLVDAQGVALGRNGSALMRGDKMAEAYPSLGESLKSGHTASDVWLNRQRQEQLLASYAPVRGDEGAIAGALVIGTPLNDEPLSRTSDVTSGRALVVSVPAAGGKQLEIISKSDQASGDLLSLVQSGPVLDAAGASLGSGGLSVLTQVSKDYVV